MPGRGATLRSFIAGQYRSESLAAVFEVADRELLPGVPLDVQVRATLVPLLLPHLTEAIEQVIANQQNSPLSRQFAQALLSYVLNPLDLFSGDGFFSWLDDVMICALGLSRLEQIDLVDLDPHTAACCQVALELLPVLPDPLRDAIEAHVTQAWQKTHP